MAADASGNCEMQQKAKAKALNLAASLVKRYRRRGSEEMYAMNPNHVMQERVVIAMVGLPARGKSYISKAVVRYLNFIGCPAKLFNAGNKRRAQGLAGTDATFFDASNQDAKAQREQMAMDCLEELLDWLRDVIKELPDGCACGIFDATNTTRERREKVMARCARERPPVNLLFLESLCDDEELLQINYRLKLVNDDYKGQDSKAALDDFMDRVKQYEAVYEPLSDDERLQAEEEADLGESSPMSAASPWNRGCRSSNYWEYYPLRYIKIIDAGRKVVALRCQGFLLQQCLGLLHSLHLGPRIIWLTIVGETQNDLDGIIGGNTSLSKEGFQYAHAAAERLREREEEIAESFGERDAEGAAMVVCGTLLRYVQMARVLSTGRTKLSREQGQRSDSAEDDRKVLKLNKLNDTCMGSMDSMSHEETERRFPNEVKARNVDKLRFRCPGAGGESYVDVMLRLQDLILRLEQTRNNIIVVADRAVSRALLAYFEGIDAEQIPNMEVAPGIHELRRSHSGFSRRLLPITRGCATRSSGPGTLAEGQIPSLNLKRSLKMEEVERLTISQAGPKKLPHDRLRDIALAGEAEEQRSRRARRLSSCFLWCSPRRWQPQQ